MPKYSKKMGYDKSGGHNEKYKSMIRGSSGKSMELMKNHGNTYPIETTAAQKFDMGRMQVRPMEYRGYPDKAFDYKY